jgi:hypothetical protein
MPRDLRFFAQQKLLDKNSMYHSVHTYAFYVSRDTGNIDGIQCNRRRIKMQIRTD